MLGLVPAVLGDNSAITSFLKDVADEADSAGDCCVTFTTNFTTNTIEVCGCDAIENGTGVEVDGFTFHVSCDTNAGPSGQNQCATQAVVTFTVAFEGTGTAVVNLREAQACSIPNVCTDGFCELCAEFPGSNLPVEFIFSNP